MPDIQWIPSAGLPSSRRTLLWLGNNLPATAMVLGVADVMVRFAPTSDLNYAAALGDGARICKAMAQTLARIEAAGEQVLDGVIAHYLDQGAGHVVFKVRWLDGDTSTTIIGGCPLEADDAPADLAARMLVDIAGKCDLVLTAA